MRASLLALLILTAAGCAPLAPQLDSRFGTSVRTLMGQQAMPKPPRIDDDTFDAAAAHGALSQYRQSFRAPAPAPRAYFSVAGGAGAGN
jgi:hypothetical protein